MKTHFSALLAIVIILTPITVFGATAPTNFAGFVKLIANFIGILVGLVFTLTLIAFIWGIIKGWIANGGDPQGIQDGRNVAIIGIIVFAIMVSIWGILYMLRSSLFGI